MSICSFSAHGCLPDLCKFHQFSHQTRRWNWPVMNRALHYLLRLITACHQRSSVYPPRLITYGPHDTPVIINGGNVLINGGENFTTQITPQGVRKQEISRNREYLFIIYSWWSFWTIERTISVLKELSPRDRKLVVLIGLIKKWKENIVTIDIGRVSFDLITKCQALGYTIWVCSNRIARKVVLFGEYRPIYEPFFMQWQYISLA